MKSANAQANFESLNKLSDFGSINNLANMNNQRYCIFDHIVGVVQNEQIDPTLINQDITASTFDNSKGEKQSLAKHNLFPTAHHDFFKSKTASTSATKTQV